MFFRLVQAFLDFVLIVALQYLIIKVAHGSVSSFVKVVVKTLMLEDLVLNTVPALAATKTPIRAIEALLGEVMNFKKPARFAEAFFARTTRARNTALRFAAASEAKSQQLMERVITAKTNSEGNTLEIVDLNVSFVLINVSFLVTPGKHLRAGRVEGLLENTLQPLIISLGKEFVSATTTHVKYAAIEAGKFTTSIT